MQKQVLAVLAAFMIGAPAWAVSDAARDSLDVPASATRLTTTTQVNGVAHAGKRLVAVGIRGLIVTSDDNGATWVQRAAPVSSDLLAVQFVSPTKGWAVGHDGVILHSEDGGESWIKQFDGRQAGEMFIRHFQQLADVGDANAQRLLGEMKLNYESGPEQGLLDLWFADERNGIVCGSFGTLLATTDGGKTWQSWVERLDYGTLLHLNAIHGVGQDIFIASEKGLVFRLDRDKGKFIAVETGYMGSFFSLASVGKQIIASGLRGTAYRSSDAGRSWQKLETGQGSSITGAVGIGAARVLMVSQNGNLLVSDDAGEHFRAIRVPRPGVLTAVTQVDAHTAVVAGLSGVQQVPLK